MRNLKIKVSYKLFHNEQTKAFAEVSATVKGDSIRINRVNMNEDVLLEETRGGVVHDSTLQYFRENIRAAIKSFVSDLDGLKFPIRYNDETCLECQFSEVN